MYAWLIRSFALVTDITSKLKMIRLNVKLEIIYVLDSFAKIFTRTHTHTKRNTKDQNYSEYYLYIYMPLIELRP